MRQRSNPQVQRRQQDRWCQWALGPALGPALDKRSLQMQRLHWNWSSRPTKNLDANMLRITLESRDRNVGELKRKLRVTQQNHRRAVSRYEVQLAEHASLVPANEPPS